MANYRANEDEKQSRRLGLMKIFINNNNKSKQNCRAQVSH